MNDADRVRALLQDMRDADYLPEWTAALESILADAERMDWLAQHLHSADFEYAHTDSGCALIIEWPRNVAVGGSLRANVDAARAAQGE